MAMEPQPLEVTHPEHWRVVERAWYPKGVPSGERFHVEERLRQLVELDYTAEELDLAVANLRAKQKKGYYEIGFNLRTVIKNWGDLQPTPEQCLDYRYAKWKAGLPPEWRTYVNMLMHKDVARQCWVDAAGRAGEFTGTLHKTAQKEWERLNNANRHHTELRNGKVVSLLDEMSTVLRKYLPGGSTDNSSGGRPRLNKQQENTDGASGKNESETPDPR